VFGEEQVPEGCGEGLELLGEGSTVLMQVVEEHMDKSTEVIRKQVKKSEEEP